MRYVALLLLICVAALGQKYIGPRPPKADLPSLKHAENLVPTEVGEAKESLAVTYKGRDFSIAFNPEFLMAPLRNLAEDEVFLDLIDEMSLGVLKIQSPFLYVLMPMRISS